MPSLSELQRAVAQRVLGSSDAEVEDWIVLPPGVDPAARLAIYTEGYPARLAESLDEAYPAVSNILGEGSFAALAARFAEHPRRAIRNLNYIGVDLPDFLSSDRLTEQLPFLADLARLEWAVVECFHARAAQPFELTECRSWSLDDWASARVEFQPGVALVCSEWPVRELRDTREQDRAAIDIGLEGGGECALVYRQGFDVVVESLDSLEALAFERLQQGALLGVVSSMLAAEGAQEEAVAQLFAHWSSLGLVAAATIAQPE